MGIPERIGRFQVRCLLGEGQFGTVYRAYDPHLQREVALKVPRLGTLNTPRRVERFLEDARAAARLRHPHIVPVYDAGQDNEHYFIASAFIEGRTLEEAMDRHRLPPREAVRIVRALAEALAYAHGQGIVHRDVKPANILLDGRGQPHLIDFGLARRREAMEPEGREAGNESNARRTQDGAVLGTAAYMSPEQASGQSGEARPAFDQYSLGVTLYELLCGRVPFSGPSAIVLYNVVHTPPPALRSLCPGIPRDLEAICHRAMAKKPRDRYAGCQELADDLRRWLDGEPVAARPLGLAERLLRWCRRQPALAAALTLAAAALLAVAGLTATFALVQARTTHELELKNEELIGITLQLGEKTDTLEQTLGILGQKSAALEEKQKDLEAKNKQLEEGRKKILHEKRNVEAARQKADQYSRQLEDALARSEEDLYFLRIARAAQHVRENQPLQAQECLLDIRRGDQRSRWEWGYLRQRCRQLSQREGRQGSIRCVRLSPDGRWLAWARADGTVLIRELTRTRPRLHTCQHPHPVDCLAFSADNSRLATGGSTGQVKVWSVPEGKELFSVQAHQGAVTSLAFHPLNQQLASGGSDHCVCTWDPGAGRKPLLELRDPSDAIRSVVYRPDGRWLVSFSRANALIIWDSQGKRVERFEGYTAGAFSPEGRRLAIANESGTIDVYNTTDLKTKIYSYRGHTSAVQQIEFCLASGAESQRVASAGADGVVRVWEVLTGQELSQVVSRAGFGLSRNGRWLAWVSEEDILHHGYLGPGRPYLELFDGNGEQRNDHSAETITLSRFSDYVHCLAVSPEGLLATGAGVGARAGKEGVLEGEVRLWRLADGRHVRVLPRHEQPLFAAAFNPTGTLLASASRDGCVKLWDVASGQPKATLVAGGAAVTCLAFSRDGKRLAVAASDRKVRLFSVDTGAALHELQGHRDEVTGVVFTADNKYLISSDKSGMIRIWDAASLAPKHDCTDHEGAVFGVAVSSDGRLLASAGADRTVRLWRLSAGKPSLLYVLGGHVQRVYGVAFSPDGKRLASASADHTVKVWDTATGREALTLQEKATCFQVAFSADGQRLIAATPEGARVYTSAR